MEDKSESTSLNPNRLAETGDSEAEEASEEDAEADVADSEADAEADVADSVADAEASIVKIKQENLEASQDMRVKEKSFE